MIERSTVARPLAFALTALFCMVSGLAGCAQESADQVFARYARYGADAWARNPMATVSGEGAACLSCHTSLPYALVEPLLPGSYPAYTDLIDNVNNRVLNWSNNTPWYSDGKLEEIAALADRPPDALKSFLHAADSRGVEAISNAFIRGMLDAYSRRPAQPETQLAFANMWSEQIQSGPNAGRWNWIRANLIPWEVADSDLWGASLACVVASEFPDLAPRDKLQLLHAALTRAASDRDVSLHVKAAILWCDTETGGSVLETGAAAEIAADLLALQRANGGWALRELGPWTEWEGSEADCCANREIRSDSYATGFVTLALARYFGSATNPRADQLDNAVAWIDVQLANPYPAEPRHNRHGSADSQLPELRDSLYTNAGHMWAFVAKTAYESQTAPWARN